MDNKETIYQQNGYESRMDYLNDLSNEYGVSISMVVACADLLGPSEDFDGLVSTIQDQSRNYW